METNPPLLKSGCPQSHLHCSRRYGFLCGIALEHGLLAESNPRVACDTLGLDSIFGMNDSEHNK
jgi:hypothetical protein